MGGRSFIHLSVMLLHAHGPLTGDPNEKWTHIKQKLTGPKIQVQQDWFDENNEINKLLKEEYITFIE